MVATELLEPGSLPKGAAAKSIANCMAEADLLRLYDHDLISFRQLEDADARLRSQRIRAAWLTWAADAQELVRCLKDAGVEESLDFQKLQALVRSVPKRAAVDVAELKRRYEQAEAGDYVTGEEARRELGLPRRR